MRRLIYSPEYAQTLAEYVEFIDEKSNQNGTLIAIALDEAAKALLKAPASGTLVEGELTEVRFIVVKRSFALYYRVTDEAIVLLRVAHVRMNRDTLRFD